MAKAVTLSSGKKLEITLAPFEDGNALKKAFLSEAMGLKVQGQDEIDYNFLKDLFCLGLSSDKIEKSVWKCFERCTYEGVKINKDTFEPSEAREDYHEVLFEVAKENLAPFTKSLFVQLKDIMQNLSPFLASRQ